MKLIWSNGTGQVRNGVGSSWAITTAPALGFAFDGVWFDDEAHTYMHLRPGGGQDFLTDSQRQAVAAYLAGLAPPSACPVHASVAGLVVPMTGVPLNAPIAISGDANLNTTNTDPTGNVTLTFAVSGNYHVIVTCLPAAFDFIADYAL